jgi:hypothetical protein
MACWNRALPLWLRVLTIPPLSPPLTVTLCRVLHKFSRFFLGVLVIKAFQKGARAKKEERLHDYNARVENVGAAEKALWDSELGLHEPDAAVAEESVYRQRTLEWRYREKPDEYAQVMLQHSFPFRVGV